MTQFNEALPQKTQELYRGKAKTIYATDDPNYVIMEFRDDASAFNGVKISQLSDKGAVNNQFNAYIMEQLKAAGIASHFHALMNRNESIVKSLKMLPLESVIRNRAAGGLVKRYGLTEGQILTPPTQEFFLKDDALDDPLLTESLIETFGYATPAQVEQIKTLSYKTNEVLTQLFAKAGLILVDFKLEFGVFEGELMLGDEFSPDGCRIWDAQTLNKLDKDRFRQGLGEVVESYLLVAERLGIPLLDNC